MAYTRNKGLPTVVRYFIWDNMKSIVFLDLEATFIDEFTPGFEFINLEYFQSIVADEVVIFSFAISNTDLQSKSFLIILDKVREIFKTSNVSVVTIEDLEEALCKLHLFRPAFKGELLSLLGKFNSFIEYLRITGVKNSSIVFFDDTVFDAEISFAGNSIRTIKI